MWDYEKSLRRLNDSMDSCLQNGNSLHSNEVKLVLMEARFIDAEFQTDLESRFYKIWNDLENGINVGVDQLREISMIFIFVHRIIKDLEVEGED